MSKLSLYSYFRSSAAYRVRIALNLKGLEYELLPVHLKRGENWRPDYLKINPQGFVPTLAEDRRILYQSLAIIEYLDEVYPDPPLLPSASRDRAHIRALAQIVACDIHPLNNQRVLTFLTERLDQSEQQVLEWYCHWILEGFKAIETILDSHEAMGRFCHGDTPTLADICLVPQLYNARRFECDLSAFPNILRIGENCRALEAFRAAAPDNQPDAQ